MSGAWLRPTRASGPNLARFLDNLSIRPAESRRTEDASELWSGRVSTDTRTSR